ncbi:nucleoside/nucleotide kinase family protein [Compostimonas suwonensis]|uniref:Zeta toxin n=1 Tax=Compostimonas suwonensis TaxID=1048394 RepID=A0A2M9BZB0_9MICO|nr:nucleoside/nucleotide kinase family protein [Compostimonas suwonensis]PJJ63410.1 zeta toxin [Compostimonas suwonensis]
MSVNASTSGPIAVEADVAALAERARALPVPSGRRVLLGLAGAPGAGKSTLAARLAAELGEQAVVVPMDGFHLAQAVLELSGLADRKGAVDTFDAAGFRALIERIAGEGEGDGVVYAPEFRRELEEPVAGAIPIGPGIRWVIVEGNYLLSPEPEWSRARRSLAEVWYLQADDELRVERLIARHVEHGRSREEAEEWVRRSDEANARVVEASREGAQLVVLV